MTGNALTFQHGRKRNLKLVHVKRSDDLWPRRISASGTRATGTPLASGVSAPSASAWSDVHSLRRARDSSVRGMSSGGLRALLGGVDRDGHGFRSLRGLQRGIAPRATCERGQDRCRGPVPLRLSHDRMDGRRGRGNRLLATRDLRIAANGDGALRSGDTVRARAARVSSRRGPRPISRPGAEARQRALGGSRFMIASASEATRVSPDFRASSSARDASARAFAVSPSFS